MALQRIHCALAKITFFQRMYACRIYGIHFKVILFWALVIFQICGTPLKSALFTKNLIFFSECFCVIILFCNRYNNYLLSSSLGSAYIDFSGS